MELLQSFILLIIFLHGSGRPGEIVRRHLREGGEEGQLRKASDI